MECIAAVAVSVWRRCRILGRRRLAKRAPAAKHACKERTFQEKTFRVRPVLNTCRAWPRWRCGHDKGTNDEHTSMEPDGTGGTTTVGAIWRNGNGPVALPQAHGSAATALCPGLGRGREVAVAPGTRVFPITGHVVHDEKL